MEGEAEIDEYEPVGSTSHLKAIEGGAAAFYVAVLVSLLQLEVLDKSLRVALYATAVGLPAQLAVSLHRLTYSPADDQEWVRRLPPVTAWEAVRSLATPRDPSAQVFLRRWTAQPLWELIELVGNCGAAVVAGATIWHFSSDAGGLFVASIGVTFFAYLLRRPDADFLARALRHRTEKAERAATPHADGGDGGQDH